MLAVNVGDARYDATEHCHASSVSGKKFREVNPSGPPPLYQGLYNLERYAFAYNYHSGYLRSRW